MNAVTKAVTPTAPATMGVALVPENMDQAIRLATAMSSAKMVPKHLQGDVGSCLMIVEQAMRWRASPFAVAQCTSNISGKLAYEGKLIAAILPSCGAILGEFDYTFKGDPAQPETLSVMVSATRASDGVVKTIELEWLKARTDNKYWTLQPEQQLVYAGSRVWARRWTPGPLLGIYAPEEFNQQKEPPPDTFTGTTLDHQPVPAAQPKPEAKPSPPVVDEPVDPLMEENGIQWVKNLDVLLANAQTQDEVVEIGEHPRVAASLETAPPAFKTRITELLAKAYARFAGDEAGMDDLEIVGQEKVEAG